MRILITFINIKGRSGGELYVFDLAMQLLKMQHTPIIFTSKDIGPLYEEVKAKGIPITTELETIGDTPDIIVGNSQEETLLALLFFPTVPSVFICHDRFNPYAIPIKSSRIYHYITVSNNIADGLIYERGIPTDQVSVIPNSVDLGKYLPRETLPSVPKRALIYSNYITMKGHTEIIQQCCERLGILVDVIGSNVGRVINNPEEVLPQYDLIFAKGRGTLEALSVGCGVILCDIEGLGPKITMKNVEYLRHSNFGWRLLQDKITVENLKYLIEQYNPLEIKKISNYIREVAGLDKMTSQLVVLFNDVIIKHKQQFHFSPIQALREVYEHLKQRGVYGTYFQLQKSIHVAEQKANQYAIELEVASNKLDIALQQINALENQHDSDRLVQEKQQEAIKVFSKTCDALQEELAQIYQSYSWRLTQFLRIVKKWIYRLSSLPIKQRNT